MREQAVDHGVATFVVLDLTVVLRRKPTAVITYDKVVNGMVKFPPGEFHKSE